MLELFVEILLPLPGYLLQRLLWSADEINPRSGTTYVLSIGVWLLVAAGLCWMFPEWVFGDAPP